MRIPDELHHIAALQHGVFSRAQARTTGLGHEAIARRVRCGQLVVVSPKVLASATTPITPMARAWAAVLSTGDDAALTHQSSAWLWQMPTDSWRPTSAPDRHHVSVLPERNPRVGDDVIVHRSRLSTSDVTREHGPPCASRAVTVFDLLTTLRASDARRLLDRALQQRWTTPREQAELLSRSSNRPGVAQARSLIEAIDAAASKAERRLHAILRQHGITGWRAGLQVYDDDVLIAELDVGFEALRIAIEVDGLAFHTDAERFQRDRTRQNDLVSRGWLVLRFTWRDLEERPWDVARRVREAVAMRSAPTSERFGA